MKYYINTNKEIFAYEEDGSQDHLIGDKVAITQEELDAINKAKEDEYKATPEYIAQEKARLKQLALDTITVEVNGKVFDGRDKDQVRMLSAIQASDILGVTSTEWKLNDDTIVEVTVNEIKQALALSIQRTGEIVKGM